MIKALTASILLILLNIRNFSLHIPTVIYGVFYGVFLIVSMYFGYKSLEIGPMSLTSLIVSFSVIIPIVYGIGFCGESLNGFKITGLIFLVIAIISVNSKKITFEKNKENYRFWLICIAATFLSNGFCSVLQKMHQINYPGKYCSEFTLVAMIVCFVIFTAIYMSNENKKITCSGKKYAALSGIAVAGVSFLTMKLTGMENAAVIFPAISAGTICASLFCGVTIFKEKLKYNHIIAFLSGITAVIFLKL